jgi:AcrR family transcriptional regulator
MPKRTITTARRRPPFATPEQLLDVAERAIRGYRSKASLDRIADRAGVSKPVLFSHVDDRREFARALPERMLGRLEQAVHAARALGHEGRPALERVTTRRQRARRAAHRAAHRAVVERRRAARVSKGRE